MIIYPSIEGLLYYAQAHLLLDDLDVVYVRNRILDELKLTDYEEYEVDYEAIEAMTAPDEVLNPIVNYAVENGIIQGMTETTLVPKGTATRAQVATILMRYCETVAK